MDDDSKILILIFLSVLVIYSSFILIHNFQFVYDEGIYALMIKEFAANPSSILPTVTHTYVEWKPPLFTWIYSVFYLILRNLPISLEAAYRLPSALFGAASVTLVYLIGSILYDKRVGLAAALLFFSSPLVLFSSSLVMMEAFATFLSLAAIYCYLKNNISIGAVALGLLVLTKWLYVLVPVLFIVLYFYKSPNLKKILLSFLVIPLFFSGYLLLSYLTGNLSLTLTMLSLDVSRPVPSSGLLNLFLNINSTVVVSLPLIIPFFAALIFFLSSKKKPSFENLPLIAVCILSFALLFSNLFLFWYLTPFVFAFALFAAKYLDKEPDTRFFSVLLIVFLLANLSLFLFDFENLFYQTNNHLVEKVANLMKGQSYYFLETGPDYSNWFTIDSLYRGTNLSYFTLDQNNPGLLFYRFNDSTDYSNLVAFRSIWNQNLPCDRPWVIHGNISNLPTCRTYSFSIGDYYFYK